MFGEEVTIIMEVLTDVLMDTNTVYALLKHRISQTVGPKRAQEIRFFGKIGSFKPGPNVSKKSDFLEKSDFSNRRPKCVQEIRFFGKSDFSNRRPKRVQDSNQAQTCPRNPIFWKNRISQTVGPKRAQEIRFFGKIGFLKP
jgi:hypothetical protein